MMIRSIVSVLLIISIVPFGKCAVIPSKSEPALLVVSFDAFRPEYLHRHVTPNLNQFAKEGTSAKFMLNVFPTKTFVNHFTVATGLYAEKHGVLANELYDAEQGKLGYSYELFHYNNNTVPIWTANEKAGKHSGCMMWPGSNFEYTGINCTYTYKYDSNMKWEDRVDIALSWFNRKSNPANLVMMYIEEPDAHGHIYGPDSPVITNMVGRLDNLTQYIQDKLRETRLDNRVNVIHLSDHGMMGVAPPNFIYLDEFVADGSCDMYGSSPVFQIVPKDPKNEKMIFANLTKAAKQNGHFKVYNSQSIPARWHANNTRRMGPIIAVADSGYGFQDLMVNAKDYEKPPYNIPITNETKYGVHGYDNQEPSMNAIFMAKGPLFAKGKTLKSVNMIDMHNLFCLILKIKCGQNDGNTKLDMYNELFAVDPAHRARDNIYVWIALGLIVLVLALIAVLAKNVKKIAWQSANLRYQERTRHLLSEFEDIEDEPLVETH